MASIGPDRETRALPTNRNREKKIGARASAGHPTRVRKKHPRSLNRMVTLWKPRPIIQKQIHTRSNTGNEDRTKGRMR